jgi:hypothetical protein
MSKTSWIAIALLSLAGGACLAQTETPSLAEAAKQKTTHKKAVLVLTDEDTPATLPSSDRSTPAAQPAATVAKTTDKAAGSTAKSDAVASDNASVSEIKNRLDSLTTEDEAWKRAAKRNEALLANETSDFRRQMYQDALDNDRKNVAMYDKQIAEAQAELAKARQASTSGSNGPSN